LTNNQSVPELSDYARIWEKAISLGDYNSACLIELKAYNARIKPTESLRAWDEWQERTLRLRRLLCDFYVDAFPSYDVQPTKHAAIVLHNFSGLAHELQLGRQVKSILKSMPEYGVYIVYAFGQREPTHSASHIYGVSEERVVYLNSKDYISAGRNLNKMLLEYPIGSVIYPTAAFFCFWLSLLCRHGNQKFLQMKYYPRQVGRIAEWAGGDEGRDDGLRTVNGEDFTALPLNLKAIPLIGNRMSKKSESLVVGSISRIEKIQDPTYINLVLDLLSTTNNIEYWITGRAEDAEKVDNRLTSHPRVKFVGWVRPESFMGNIDIYLDPWPQGGGDMSFMAIANGIPYLTLVTEEGRFNGPLSTIQSLARSSSNFATLNRYLCKSLDEVKGAVAELVLSAERRKDCSESWRDAANVDETRSVQRWLRYLYS
jgi:hypothetical protein